MPNTRSQNAVGPGGWLHRMSAVIKPRLPGRASRGPRLTAGALALVCAALMLGGCVYHLGIQQGNLVDPDRLDKVQIGMTRSQVRYLVGTPMVSDPFHQHRWDYPYYVLAGHDYHIAEKNWFVVYFQNDQVVRIDRNPGQGKSSVNKDRKTVGPTPIHLADSAS